jgi:tRNA pseudouridine38-40 synthase
MNHFRLKIRFNGAQYFGWQIQPDQVTVQGTLNQAIETIFKTNDFKTIGSGRTDTGVHALNYFVKLSIEKDFEIERLPDALNSRLPQDIRVLSAQVSEESFRPTNDAKSKEYRYYFTNEDFESVFYAQTLSNISYDLNFESMQQATKLFIGEHDFKDFSTEGSDPTTTIRSIYECELFFVENKSESLLPSYWCFRVVGNGFLKQMVRLLVGTLWSVGRGKTTLEDIKNALKSPTGKKLGAVAPPNGLFKHQVTY